MMPPMQDEPSSSGADESLAGPKGSEIWDLPASAEDAASDEPQTYELAEPIDPPVAESSRLERLASSGLTGVAPRATGVACHRCGYNLTGAVIGGACPECGQVIELSSVGGVPASGYAIATLVLGIVSATFNTAGCMCGGPLIGLPCGVLGLVFGVLARRQIESGQLVGPGSAGMTRAGVICSVVGLAFSLLWGSWFAWLIWQG